MACVKLSIVLLLSLLAISAQGGPTASKELNGVEVDRADQLTSGSGAVATKALVPDSEVAASGDKGDLKSADSFGLGYYLPIVAPAYVKYHYPLLYYHPAAYIHSIRHHGYGGYGFHYHGHGVLH